MEQVIKINVSEGKIAKFNPETNVIEFVDKDHVRSKSWEEFCKNHTDIDVEYFLRSDSSVDKFTHLSRRIDIDKNLLATKEDAEGILALIQLTRLHDEWVGNWKPKGEDYNCIAVNIADNNIVQTCISCGFNRLLAFPTKKMANEFFKCFKDLIEKAKKFI